jgi:hypothetical protein
VMPNAQGTMTSGPLDYNTFKEIRKSVWENGVNGPFTKGITDYLSEHYHMTPWDWQHLANTCLEAPQYLTCRAEFIIFVFKKLDKINKLECLPMSPYDKV